MIKAVLKVAAILFMLAVFVGCASSSHPAIQPKPVIFSKPISLDCIFVNTTSPLSRVEAEKKELNDAIVSELRESELFVKVSDDRTDANSSPGIKIEAEIMEIKRVTDEARDWAGVLAGKARIVVHVTISDLATRNRIESFECEGRSGQMAYGGTTEEAIQRVAEVIRREVVKLNAQSSQ